MTKEQEIMNYLSEKVFDPILNSSKASAKLKSGINLTIARMGKLDAKGKRQYFWSAVIGTDKSISFAKEMKAEGFTRFEECIEEFRIKFDDEWVKRK